MRLPAGENNGHYWLFNERVDARMRCGINWQDLLQRVAGAPRAAAQPYFALGTDGGGECRTSKTREAAKIGC